MSVSLAIAVYRCTVDGIATESLDIRVRYFSSKSESEIRGFLESEKTQSYLNSNGEPVEWPFVKILAVEELGAPNNGEEVVGFITASTELANWSAGRLD